MADLEDVIKALRETADELEVVIPQLLLGQEITAKSLVQNRVQETGESAKGGKLGSYSTRKIPAFFFIGKGTKATDQKLKRLSQQKKLISYADFRKLDGKQNKYVDLTFTGKMWKDTGLVKATNNKNEAEIVIGQKTERSKKIGDLNTKRYGNWLALSDEELALITQDMADEVEEIIEKNLSGL